MKTNRLFLISLVGAIFLYHLAFSLWGEKEKEKKSMTDKTKGTVTIYDVVSDSMVEVPMVNKEASQWETQLNQLQFLVTRQCGTERPFSGKFVYHKKKGVYQCSNCGTDLFRSEHKYESGSGWPSFNDVVSQNNIVTEEDFRLSQKRIEVKCARCGAHLGHVFPDGPQPTGMRYCVNSVSLQFQDEKSIEEERQKEVLSGELERKSVATFGAGCFWGIEEVFRKTKGVLGTAVGYMGGDLKDPTYRDVCTGDTGHAEVVQVTYDPSVVSYSALLDIFWKSHNPTTLNRQGPDVGTQYRSVVFFHSDSQKGEALRSKKDLDHSGKYRNPVVTEVVPAKTFYRAEEYHQKYLKKRGLEACHY